MHKCRKNVMIVNDSKHLIGWVLKFALKKYFEGNKTKMADTLELDRHTIWRAFRVIESGEGTISSLLIQQLVWHCMKNGYSLDDAIRVYNRQNNAHEHQECERALGNWQGYSASKEDDHANLIGKLITALQDILCCSHRQNQTMGTSKCRFRSNCPIIQLSKEIEGDVGIGGEEVP